MLRYLTFLLVLVQVAAFGQVPKGMIKGKVTFNGAPLAYTSVAIKGTSLGTTSDEAGRYEVQNVPEGVYTVIFSNIGYQSEELQANLRPGATVQLNVSLKENTTKLNELVVTGVSRATEVKKSPIPVATLSRREININVSSNIIDAVVKGVPGVSAVTTGPNISKPFIRGLGYNRVLNLYDGIRQEGQQWGDEHGTEVDPYGVGRVEVVKGPASLTYGSDAQAGVINMIPYIPQGNDGKVTGDALAEYHTNNGMMGSSVGIAYSDSGWKYYFRASGKRAHNYQNRIDGPVFGTAFREYHLTGTVRREQTWGYSQLSATFYDNLQEIPDGSRDSLTRKFTRPIFSDERDDIKNRPIVPESALRTYAIHPLHQYIQHYRLYSHNQLKVGQGDINLTWGFQQSKRREFMHPNNLSQAALYLVLNTTNYDLRYNLPTWKELETTVGVNGMFQINRNLDATDFAIPDFTLFDVGTFVFTKRSFGKVDVSGGIRYDSRHLSWADFYVGQNPRTGFDEKVSPDTPGADLQFPAFAKQFQGMSGSAGLTYNISERLLLKGNVARGYRSPNITEVGSNGLDPGARIVYLGNRNFVPEFNLQKDLSFLAYLKNVDISAEVFDNQIQNFIYQARLTDANGQPVVDDQGNITFQYQQSRARLYGGELTLNLHPQKVKGLAFNNSLAYVVGLNKNKALINEYGDDARYLPFIPPLHFRSEVRGTVQKSLGPFSGLYARLELDVYGDQNRFYAVDNTETFTAGYTLVNAGFGTTVKRQTGKTLFEFFFQADNLFDVAYQSNLSRLKYFEYYSASPTGHFGVFNMGRNFSFKVIVPF